jgi:hypothetical protein
MFYQHFKHYLQHKHPEMSSKTSMGLQTVYGVFNKSNTTTHLVLQH